MSTKHRWALLATLVITLLVPIACKKKKLQPTLPPVTGPGPTTPADPVDPSPGYTPPTGGGAVGWPHQSEPDQGQPVDLKATKTGKKAAPVPSDADIAKRKEAQDREDTEKLVEASVTGVLTKVKDCFEQHKATPGQLTLRVRVHRSGRVLSSNVSGVSGEANRCVEGVMSQLHVSGMKTDTIDVERTLTYKK